MRKKGLVAFGLAAVMTASALTGCGGASDKKEITVITFFYAKWNVDIDFHGRICDIPSLHCNLLLL